METLKYKVIKTEEEYQSYCKKLEDLVFTEIKTPTVNDEIELLTFLIEKWDQDHNTFQEADPIKLLKGLMAERHLKAKDLVEILGISKGLVSDILNYKKGLSKEVIRALAGFFKLSQEAFNRPYKLQATINSHIRNASVMNTTKEGILH
ncbi:helix-turn-helix domain-containing protein (plasmid) [Adhaeribacter swui]|uniref:Helix-turn-helix domain-containing protein n=1 Tax=Adhaeribacter swui TaxID=2086471 RepID=A0A7G7G2J8_9BACT|nr:helix-turn-helix domain-containing protein [Adhaeribacter swui]QNF31382.1 helix-turn-helix domain-containing protein [Adhaeribacter swui]